MEEGKGTVCVTGGTGFIASMMIKRLLAEGYSVNTTVRSPSGNSTRDVSFLTNLPGASQKLKIFNADLNNPESFGAAIEGCIGVFQTATPMYVEEPVEIMTSRTINGALGILKACINSKTVKRVVYTAAGTNATHSGKEVEEVDESYWSDVDLIQKTKPAAWSYSVSQTLAEKAVLEFGEQHGLDVVTVLLPFVIGPFICPHLPESVRVALPWLFGCDLKEAVRYSPVVHVDDVARAHIFLLEHPNPKGRYICSLSGVVTSEEMAELVRAKYPEIEIPTPDPLKGYEGWIIPRLNPKKLIDAGFQFKYGTKEIFEEAMECCKEKGYFKFGL